MTILATSHDAPVGLRTARAAGAFTLVEMLLVVAMLAMLISILLPSMSQAKEEARRAICLSQLRQVFAASVDYATAQQRRFPPRPQAWSQYHVGNFDPPSGKDSYVMGLKLLVDAKTLAGASMLFCPSDKLWSVRTHWPDLPFGASWKPYLSSYAQREERLTDDHFSLRNAPPRAAFLSDWFTTAIPANPWANHDAGWNVSYFDGAAMWVKRTPAIWAGINWSHDFTGQGVTWRAFDR